MLAGSESRSVTVHGSYLYWVLAGRESRVVTAAALAAVAEGHHAAVLRISGHLEQTKEGANEICV